ncbi:hypothetical protein GCM10027035_45940 [Emticicia sediminis]
MGLQMSVAEILHSAENLESKNFDKLYSELSILKAKRRNIALLNEQQSLILDKINEEFDPKKLERLKYLDWKLEFSLLSPAEEKESLKLAETYEAFCTERLKNVSQLALIRQISIDELLEQLGLNTASHG